MSCKGIILSNVSLPDKIKLTDMNNSKFVFPDDTGIWFKKCTYDNDWTDILNKMKEKIPEYWYEFDTINTYSSATDESIRKEYAKENEKAFTFISAMLNKNAEIWFINLWTDMDFGSGESLCITNFNISPYIGKFATVQSELILCDNEMYRFVLK